MTKNKHSILDIYGVAFGLTALALLMVVVFDSFASLLPILILIVVEVTFSFENAVINSQVLAHLSEFWQKIFLTIGIAVAVFGVRLILPLVLVSATTASSVGAVFDLALHDPEAYAHALHTAYPLIAAFGGVFLLMIGLRFFGERREVYWLDSVEAPLGEFNQPWWIVGVGATSAVLAVWALSGFHTAIAVSAALGGMVFVIIKGFSELLVRSNNQQLHHNKVLHGKAAFMQFLYLELLDASFSFDGVIAAFAITKKVFLIAIGLGIGALYVRSITVHLLKRGTLSHYRYLVHGAHYAIGSLAIVLLASVRFEIPEFVTGVVGLLFISAALHHSVRHNRQHAIV